MSHLCQAVEHAETQLRGSDVDAKLGALHELETSLLAAVEDIPNIDIDALRPAVVVVKSALKTANARVHISGLSTANALLSAVEAGHHAKKEGFHSITASAISTLVPAPGILASLADPKDATRQLACQILVQAGKCAAESSIGSHPDGPNSSLLSEVDQLVKEQAFGSKNARAREQALIYLSTLRRSYPNLPLKTWTPILVATLEDGDTVVREVARDAIVDIYTMPTVPAAAKADLKKEIIKQGVRRTTSDSIIKRVLGGSALTTGLPRPSSSSTIGSTDTEGDTSRASSFAEGSAGPSKVSNTSRTSGSNGITPKPAGRGDRLLKQPKNLTQEEILAQIDRDAAAAAPPPSTVETNNTVSPVYIASPRDLDQEVVAMCTCFEGKESEHNWQAREKAIYKLRGFLVGNAPKEFAGELLHAVKTLSEGVVKALVSLRTTLAIATCSLLSESTATLGVALSSLYDPFFTALIGLAPLTKKAVAKASQEAADQWIRYCGYQGKMLPLLSAGMEQKTAQARVYIAKHILVYVQIHADRSRNQLEASGGRSVLEQVLRKGLTDSNTNVRETFRSIYTELTRMWPAISTAVHDSADAALRRQLDKHLADHAASASANGAKQSTKSITAAASVPRQSIRDLITSRRAASASNVPTVASPGLTSASTSPSTTPYMRRQSSAASISPSTSRSRGIGSASPPQRRSPLYGDGRRASASSSAELLQNPSNRARSLSGSSNGSAKTASIKSSPLRPAPSTSSDRSLRGLSQIAPSRQVQHQTRPPTPPSPTLSALGQDYSDAENYTFNIANTVPLPHDTSSEDESLDVSAQENNWIWAEESYEDTSGHAMLRDLSDVGVPDSYIRNHAEQAEQTAYRLLQQIEPDIDDGNATIMLEDLDAPGSTDPGDSMTKLGGSNLSPTPESRSHTVPPTVITPLLQRMQDLHLKDSPALRLRKQSNAEEPSWWQIKADLQVANAEPYTRTQGQDVEQDVESDLEAAEAGHITSPRLLKLARISLDRPCLTDDASSSNVAFWTRDGLFTRLLTCTCKVLGNTNGSNEKAEEYLILLKNLVSYQSALVQGREVEIFGVLLSTRQRTVHSVSEGAQAVLKLFVARLDVVYALSGLRLSLVDALAKNSVLDEGSAQAYAMALRVVSNLLSQLPSEVLEDELENYKGLILGALNNTTFPYLRKAATAALVQSHSVTQDDERLFKIMDGLTKSQRTFIGYLFKQEQAKN